MPADPARKQKLPTPPQQLVPEWPVTWRFREEIANQESRGSGGYRARNGEALGAYQMRPIALKEAGWLDSHGRWTSTAGVNSDEEFLNDPMSQERALEAFLAKSLQRLKSGGATRYVGQTIRGVKDDFPITESGLVTAVHREGYPAVVDYLKNMEQRGWVSDEDSLSDEFKAIETRLRDFSRIPYRRPFGH